MESLSTRRRRPLKPATLYGWQHCLDRWILPNLGNKLVSEVGNGALRQFVEILTAARLAPKTFVNVVTVVEALFSWFLDRKSTRLNSSHGYISYAVFCLKKKKNTLHSTAVMHHSTPS